MSRNFLLAACDVAALGALAYGTLTFGGAQAKADSNSLTIKVRTEIAGANCRPVADYSIGKDHPLRLVNYTITMTGPGSADRTEIPSGAVLMPSSDVKRDRSISLHNHEATCSDMKIVWTDFECEGEDRQPMQCPPILLIGGADFKSVEVVQPASE